MSGETINEIDALGTMTLAELRARYAEVFGEPTRSGNRRWLVRRIAWRLQARAEGDLSERARRRVAELARDEDLRLGPPALPSARQPAPGANVRTVTGRLGARPDDRLPVVGTVLTRRFNGVEHRVRVLPNGFEHRGTVYRSLSAVAQAISGSHWNGYLFFGLARPRRRGEP